jgi:SAM-dependent methyltransferase
MAHGHHHDRQHDHDQEPTLEELRKELTADYWDERYAGSDRVWSGNPNRRLVEQAADLTPGYALDVGCGEGADAIWLAGQGWHVTAVDVSEVALERTAAHAIEKGVDDRVDVGFYDLLGDRPPRKPHGKAGFDLVSAHFIHVPEEDFAGVYHRIAAAVAPGGRLLVVAHHPMDVETGARHSHGPGLLFGPERVLRTFGAGSSDGSGEWEVETAEALDREQDMPDGPMQVRDTVVRLRRR